MENNIKLGSAEEQQIAQQKNAKMTLRNEINYYVADTDSLVGTASDLAHLLLTELSGFVNKLSEANSLAEMRASTESLKNAIGAVENKVASAEVVFPYQAKLPLSVIDEVVQRANGVSQLINKQNNQS
ncbi:MULTISPECIES: hypothetical protein [Pseudoalteromonas]|uniref:Uncharacterized protein n=1 Tax=Pseudoalteromonas luteoviolacea (strain 2ta16) TaxID=1353533 RepID=V4JKV9_PSEL2|nr:MULTISPECIES: hypothetical protein [Pseudoalteromonas]ESP95482.1 hypothetical protein PL2TA16_02225 [Pseudoalteromonas luteoviolacea 2ta16]KZN31126.1 hypothetical protein N483_04710 [Pseudoalteromonas luteoviolacea NCIMB 1944]MCG7548457.1 hypothetical protein [Pseudoalteromonas sp. Of7M-16]